MTTTISHRPHGSEHPYIDSPDQRVPVTPEVGVAVELRVITSSDVTAVTCEWVARTGNGEHTVDLSLTPIDDETRQRAALAAIGGDGHLAEAQAASDQPADGVGWQVHTPPVNSATRYRYRFVAHGPSTNARPTDWFECQPVVWVATAPAGGEIAIAPTHLVDGTVMWRRASTPTGLGAADRIRFSMPLADGERVTGFGERFDRVDQRGHVLDAVVFEQYKGQAAAGKTYLPMPFAHVIGGSGWGFHVNTSRRTWFDIGVSDPSLLTVEAALGTSPTLTVATYDGTPDQVLSAFTAEVGRAELLPDWVFRLWASGNEWNTQDLVLEQMNRHRDTDIPVGAVVIEAWSDECTFTTFRDSRYQLRADGRPPTADDFSYPVDGAWPDPKAMIDELHARGIKVVLWQIPLQRTDANADLDTVGQAAEYVAEMEANDYAVREADGSPYRNLGWWFPQALMPDLTDEKARKWWVDQRRYLVRDLDIDGFKTDGGEHAWGHDLQYSAGRGDEVNNRFPVDYARTFGDLLREEGKAPVTFSRAGFTGTQAHGIVWAGDEDSTWTAFEASVTAGITASASGIVYWGWDIAGFSGQVPDADLYLRATAASVFMPIMQYHSEFNHHRTPLRDRTPWNIAEQTGDPTVIEQFRNCVRLREKLVPYLAEQAKRAIETGHPLMRALYFDWPADSKIWEFPRQYLLGDDFLIAPVTAPEATRWPVYLPAGNWVDAWTGQQQPGGGVINRDVTAALVSVYCRAETWPARKAIFDHTLT